MLKLKASEVYYRCTLFSLTRKVVRRSSLHSKQIVARLISPVLRTCSQFVLIGKESWGEGRVGIAEYLSSQLFIFNLNFALDIFRNVLLWVDQRFFLFIIFVFKRERIGS